MALEIYKSNSTGTVNTSSASFTEVASLSIDRSEKNGEKTFLLGAFTSVSSDNTNSLMGLRSLLDSEEINVWGDDNKQLDIIGSSRFWPFCSLKKAELDNSAHTWSLEAKTDVGTLDIDGYGLFAVPWGGNWDYSEDDSEESTTSETLQYKNTLDFFATKDQDYLILAVAEMKTADESNPFELSLVVDDTVVETYNADGLQSSGNDNRYVVLGFANKQTLTKSRHIIKLGYKATDTSTEVSIRNTRLVVIPLSTGQYVENVYSQEDDNDTTEPTSNYSTFDDVETLTETVLENDHLMIAFAKFAGADATEQIAIQPSFGGDTFGRARLKDADQSSGNYHTYLTGMVKSLTAGSTDFKIQGSKDAGETAHFDNKKIFILDLTESIGGGRWNLGDAILPRPKKFNRQFLRTERSYQAISGKVSKDFANVREIFMLRWDVLTENEFNSIKQLVEQNEELEFSVSDGSLTINSTNVFAELREVRYVTPGSDYISELALELVEVS